MEIKEENTVAEEEHVVRNETEARFQFSTNTSFVELSTSSWHPARVDLDRQTYLRGCKWSPDGTCCLSVVNNDGVHLIELPRDLYEGDSVRSDRPVDVLDSVIHVPENGSVYDFCWYPGMNSMAPETCCWITTGQNKPIHMRDAFDGSVRCSYRGYDDVDEVEAAISLCFSNDSTQIHAGYKKNIKTFDVERPGREYVNQKIAGSAACLSVSSCHDIIAVGSWKTDISMYNINQGSAKSIGKLRGHTGGITHLKFFPDGQKLVSGARKDDRINVWDVRIYKMPVMAIERKVATNQRIYFDVSDCGKYIMSGGTDGFLRVWDVTECVEDSPKAYLYPLHGDCCNGVSIHPYKPILATSTGQHHFPDDIWKDEYYGVSENNGISDKIDGNSETDRKMENFLTFWWTGKISEAMDVSTT